MRAVVARRLRKAIYGDLSLKAREHFHYPKKHGTVIADRHRQAYQGMKRAYKRGEVRL